MYLAEALLLRGDLQTRQKQLKHRIKRNLITQEGDRVAEDPAKLLKQLKYEYEELSKLIAVINHANDTHTIEGENGTMTITQALARRDHLKGLSAFLRDMGDESVPTRDMYSRSEIRKVAVMNADDLHREADKVSRDLRELTVRLQRSDWLVVLEGYTPPEAILDPSGSAAAR